MRPTNKLFLFALLIFFLFGSVTVPVVHAFDLASVTVTPLTCDDTSADGIIETSEEADYYSIVLVAGQKFIIDVDTFDQGETLDTILEVYVHPDTETPIALNDRSSDDPLDEDPYLEINVDAAGTYYLRLYDSTSNGITGAYTLSLECSEPGQTNPPEFTWPVVVGDLLGATGSDTGSLINIIPENAKSSLPFPLGVGPIADIDYQFSTHKIFVAVNDNFGSLDNSVSIVAIDPNSGAALQTFSVPKPGTVVPTLIALEAAENTLYGVQADPASEKFNLVKVAFDASDPTPTATLTPAYPFTWPVWALAYHSVEKVIYGVVSIGTSSHLVKIQLEPEIEAEIASAPIVDGTGQPVDIMTLDFSHDNFLFGVDLSGSLHQIDLTSGQAVSIGDPIAGVSSLTFVVGEPPDVDPIKTICSSTLTTSASASSETAFPKLSRFRLKKNPLHRAIGLFKFEGMEGETVTINITAEEEASAEAVVEESSVNELDNPWLHWKGKGRVFLGIRDSIPGLDFRARKKDQLPLNLSATLPADGTYYVMVIRPLLRFYQTDYCVTLESNFLDSQAWQSFDVAWPNDESEDDPASTCTEEPADVQNDTETVAGASADDSPVPVALSTTAIEPTTAPPAEEITVEETAAVPTEEVNPAENPRDPVDVVDESDSEAAPTDAGDTTVEEPVAETSSVVPEPAADGGGDTEVVQTDAGDTTVDEPVAETPAVSEPAADGGGDTEVVQTDAGDTTVDEPAGVTVVDEPVVETPAGADPAADEGGGTESGDDTVADEYSDDPMEDPLPMKG